MTYKELVRAIRSIADNHYMIKDFGYGDLSDIKANIDAQEADYPYLFLNPQSHTRTERTVNYRFNMIMMEMSLGDDHLTTQSDCAQYIDDVLAELKYNYAHEFDLDINFTLTPFNERFQDVVAGMTCDITIEVPQKLNLCQAPFTPVEPVIPTLLQVFTNVPESGNDINSAYYYFTPDFVNYPEITSQLPRMNFQFSEPGPYNLELGTAPEVILEDDNFYFFNIFNPALDVTSYDGPIRAGVYKITLDVEFVNVQGIEPNTSGPTYFPRIEAVAQGDVATYITLPPPSLIGTDGVFSFPADGTPVRLLETNEYYLTIPEDIENFNGYLYWELDRSGGREFWRVLPGVANGPVLGYRGNLKVEKIS